MWYNSTHKKFDDNVLDGEMLSDGSVSSRSSITARYEQSCKFESPLLTTKSKLESIGVESSVKIQHTKLRNRTYLSYRLETNTYRELRNLFERWYSEWYPNPDDESLVRYKKTVPKDVKLTPECVANWYMGDGSYQSLYVKLSTHGFTKEDVYFLSDLICHYLDIHNHVNKYYYKRLDRTYYYIVIGRKKDVNSFFRYINDYILDCYLYKLPQGSDD